MGMAGLNFQHIARNHSRVGPDTVEFAKFLDRCSELLGYAFERIALFYHIVADVSSGHIPLWACLS